MPTYEVVFRQRAAKAFQRLSTASQRQIAKKLKERCLQPKVSADQVRDIPNAYRLKLRSAGIRLIYMVRDEQLVILVLSVGRREREEAYKDAIREFLTLDE
jgi:mRNA interferase RelE/StbE